VQEIWQLFWRNNGVTTDLTAGPSVPTTFESEIESAARGEHLVAIRGDTGTRMTTYQTSIRQWDDSDSVTASEYKMQLSKSLDASSPGGSVGTASH
jgi:hypothetical protein